MKFFLELLQGRTSGPATDLGGIHVTGSRIISYSVPSLAVIVASRSALPSRWESLRSLHHSTTTSILSTQLAHFAPSPLCVCFHLNPHYEYLTRLTLPNFERSPPPSTSPSFDLSPSFDQADIKLINTLCQRLYLQNKDLRLRFVDNRASSQGIYYKWIKFGR